MPFARHLRTTGLIAILLTCTCGTTYAQPTITDIGIVPGAPDSYATGLSLDGTVVVGSCNGTQRAWRWTQADGMIVLPLGPNASTNLAASVSGDGNHTAGSVFNTSLNRRLPKFWIGSNGPLGFTLPAPWNGGTMNDVSFDGTYYVGVLTNSNAPGNKTAARFGNSVDIIPPVANRSASEAIGMSADGQTVAGTASQPSNRAFRWTAANGSEDIGLLPGASEASALGISADGSTIFGESRTSSNIISAFKWTEATGIVELPASTPTLQPRATCSTADGSVIFGTNAYLLPAGTAMMWSGDAPSVFLHDHLQSLGVDLTDWQLTGVAGASSDGSVVAGTGYRSGVQHAFVVSGLPRMCGPSVTSSPQSQFVVRGDTASLSVIATSNSALSYQWFDEAGTALSDGLQTSGSTCSGSSTDTLTIINAQVADTARYSCRVSDACSSAMSSLARIVVNYPCGQGQETIPAGTQCTFTSQDCGNLFELTRATGGVLMLEYTTPVTHCSDVGMRFFVDNTLAATTNFLAPGESSGIFDVGPVSPTLHTISMEAFGREGGCNAGALEAWSGEVTITTSISAPSISTLSVHSLACELTPANYEISVSGGGPALVTWEISDPFTPGNWLPIAEGVNLASSSAPAFIATTTATANSLSISAAPGFFDDWTTGSAFVRAKAQNSCDVAYGDEFSLTVQPTCGPMCDSIDFNNDTSLFDPQDIDAFLSVYSEGPCIPEEAVCNDIDFNNDGSLFDPCDIDSFLLQFSEGPCTLCGT